MNHLIEALLHLPLPITILLRITLALALAWLIHLCLLKRNPRWRVLLWRCTIVGLLTIPVLTPCGYWKIAIAPQPVSQMLESLPVTPTVPTAAIRQAEPLPTNNPALPTQIDINPQHRMSFRTWAVPLGMVLYSAVALLLIIRLYTASLRVHNMLRSSQAAPQRLQSLLDRVVRDLGGTKQVTLRYTPDVVTPLLTGLRRPIVILPERMIAPDYAPQLPAVLAHEITHLASRDLL